MITLFSCSSIWCYFGRFQNAEKRVNPKAAGIAVRPITSMYDKIASRVPQGVTAIWEFLNLDMHKDQVLDIDVVFIHRSSIDGI